MVGDGVDDEERKKGGVITSSGHGGDSDYQAEEEAGEVGTGSLGRASNE